MSGLRPLDAREVPEHALQVLRTLQEAGHAAWLAGGCVRDLLLGGAAQDFDVATSARPESVVRLFAHTVPTGLVHGTVTVVTTVAHVEVTTFRGEGRYLDGRRPSSVHFLDDITGDLARRDLTVNAIAWDPLHAAFADPFDGQRDLVDRVIRAVGDPVARFTEDGLRPLRAVRFATTLRFRFDRATRRAIASALPSFEKVAAERVKDELSKLLVRGQPPSRGIELMRRTGLLARVVPELLEGVGFEQNRWHAYDVYRHTLHALDHTPPDLGLRLAGLLHDIAKPRTASMAVEGAPLAPRGEHHFYDHEHVGRDVTLRILERLKFPRKLSDHVALLVDEHNWHYRPEWSDGTVRRHAARIGLESLAPLWALRRADLLARGRYVDEGLANLDETKARFDSVLAQDRALKIADLDVRGPDVMAALGVGPGPVVGQAMRWLLERVLDEPSVNRRETLLALLVSPEAPRFASSTGGPQTAGLRPAPGS